jgi:hypothetical protein
MRRMIRRRTRKRNGATRTRNGDGGDEAFHRRTHIRRGNLDIDALVQPPGSGLFLGRGYPVHASGGAAMRCLFLVVALTATLHAVEAETPRPLPAAARAATKTIVELQKALKDATRSGDLDSANAVKAQMDELMARNDADSDTDLLGNRKADPAKLVLGRWNWTKTNGGSGIFVFTDDGKVVCQIGLLNVPGTWTVEDRKQITIVWVGNVTRWEHLLFDGNDKLSGDSFDAGKDGISVVRIPAK